MKIFNLLSCVCLAGFSLNTMAADFSFDRPGAGMGTGITPVGQLAWEQGLPSASYNESTVDGEKQKTVTLNGDMLFRTGLAKDLELQLGWQGPAWTQVKRAGQTVEEDGLGDVSIGLKKAIDLDDDKLTMGQRIAHDHAVDEIDPLLALVQPTDVANDGNGRVDGKTETLLQCFLVNLFPMGKIHDRRIVYAVPVAC